MKISGNSPRCAGVALRVAPSLIGVGVSVALAAPAAAQQVVPDAGSLQRDLRQGIIGGTAGPRPPVVPQGAPEATAPSGDVVHVERFVIDGATLIPVRELEIAVSAYAGRSLDLRQLQAAAQAVADVYRRRGYFARTLLPPQDASSGVIHITVIEGRFGRVLLDDQAKRADADFVRRIVAGRLVSGAPYSAELLERGVLIANDVPGVRADAVLKAGDTPGTSDLALTVRDAPLVSGYVGADNGGVKASGLYRGIASIAVNGLTGHGDQLTLLGLGSRNLGFGQLGWSTPIGTGGWRLGVYGSYLRYKLGDGFAAVDGRGEADTQGMELSYPVLRTEAQALRLRVTYEHGHYHDDLFGMPAHRKQIHRVMFGLAGEGRDLLGGGGRTRYVLGMTLGGLDLSGLALDRAIDAVTARTQGAFGKINAEVSRDQRLAGAALLRLRMTGQWSLANLDSSEQFALGGPYGVRAYPANEALGDRGVVGNVELHLPVTRGALKGVDLYAFVDAGLTQRHAQTWRGWGPAGADNGYGLTGAGIGISYALPGGINVSGVFAAPFGPNHGADASDRNQDGSRRRARGWFTVTKTFGAE